MARIENRAKIEKWLKEILKKENFKEISFEFPTNYDTTGGYSSDIIFVKAKGIKKGINNQEKILQLLIKQSKDDFVGPEAKGDFNFEQGYSNEVHYYTKILPFFDKFAEKKNTEKFNNVPRCYGTLKDDKTFVLVLENLKQKGYKVNEIKTSMDSIQTKLVLEAYAKFHSFSFAIKDQEPEIFKDLSSKAKSFTENPIFELFSSTIDKELDKVKNLYKSRKNKENIIKKLENLKEVHGKLFKEASSIENDRFLVLRHGDNWNNNFLFHYDKNENIPDKVVIIDWQLGVLGSPMMEVMIFLFFCCSLNVLEGLYELLDFYYDNLAENIRNLQSDPKKCLPKEYFLTEFNKYVAIGVSLMPGAVKMRHQVKMKESMESSDFSDILDMPVRNVDEYMKEIDGILEFCIEKGFI